MKVLGIIAEYNPFHNGHLYQLTEAKRITESDACVVVMSGNFTQRGEFGMLNKKARAEAVIRCGADLVIELPLAFSVSTAERFAFGGIALLKSLCDVISCGCETGTRDRITEAAELLLDPSVKNKISDIHKCGISYASARQTVIATLRPDLGTLLSNPNDILAVEYQKALSLLPSGIPLIPVKRLGAGHESNTPDGNIASAGYIRRLGFESCHAYLPPESYRVLEREREAGRIAVFPSDTVISYLRRLSPEELACFPDVREGLEYRIRDAIRNSVCFEEIISRSSTKRYTRARIRRILLSAYLNIDQELSAIPIPPYIRVLGMNRFGQEILRRMSQDSPPVISRSNAVSKLSDDARLCFDHECFADDLYTMAYSCESERKCGSNQRLTPYIE